MVMAKEEICEVNLYRVSTKRWTVFVLAPSMNDAKDKFEKWLNENNYGYYGDREVVEVFLMAHSNFNTLGNNPEQCLFI